LDRSLRDVSDDQHAEASLPQAIDRFDPASLPLVVSSPLVAGLISIGKQGPRICVRISDLFGIAASALKIVYCGILIAGSRMTFPQ
jgi:hypothetical protein